MDPLHLPPLGWSDDLPDAVLVAGVDVREGGTGDRPVGGVYDAPAGVLTPSLVRVELVTNPTVAGVSSQGIDTLVFTPVVRAVALVVLFHEAGGEARLLHGSVRHELDPKAVGGGLDVLRHLVAAECSQQRSVGVFPVPDLQEVVDAVVVVLDLERLKLQRHLEL